jgi:hypothetical protein
VGRQTEPVAMPSLRTSADDPKFRCVLQGNAKGTAVLNERD